MTGTSCGLSTDYAKCDAKPGGCSQCQRTGRECPGYRKQIDVIFQDQSERVVRKEQIRATKKLIKSTTTEDRAREESIDGAVVRDQRSLDLTISISPSIEERATCFFVSSDAAGIAAPGFGDLEGATARHLWSVMDPLLTTSVKAASLASYARFVYSADLERTSRYAYVDALRRCNTALASPTEATKDSTLLSVLLLGHYEMTTGKTHKSMDDWAAHARGSSMLLRLRGREQFRTAIGRRMFLQATSNILGASLQRNLRVPDYIVEMTNDLGDITAGLNDYLRTGTSAFKTMLDINQFRCDINDGLVSDPESLIARALELDASLATVWDEPLPKWRFETHHLDAYDPEAIFDGVYHIYPSPWSARYWNSLRLFRAMMHEQVRRTLMAGLTSHPPIFTETPYALLFQTSTDMCHQMQAEILASVPEALGYVQKLDSPGPGYVSFSHLAYNPSSSYGAGGSVIWPLWYAGTMTVTTPRVGAYCVRSLRKIGETMGSRQALFMADDVEAQRGRQAWCEKLGQIE